jgi:chromosome segregation ATPase
MREEVRRAVAELPEVQARLEVRLNEVVEIQRDAEARAKRQADEFRDQIEKDWKAFVVEQEEKWFERDRRIADYEPRLVTVEEEIPTLMPQVTPLYEILESFAKSYAASGREWLALSGQMLDRARMNKPSETKMSRRQRRKKSADAGALKPENDDNDHVPGVDDDLVH